MTIVIQAHTGRKELIPEFLPPLSLWGSNGDENSVIKIAVSVRLELILLFLMMKGKPSP